MFSAKRIFFLTVSIALVVSSCKTRKMIKTADRLFEEGSFYNSTEYYIPATEKKPNNTRLTYQLGAANMAMRDYATMAEYFGQTTTANEKAWPDARYYYAEALQMQGEYDSAAYHFNQFLTNTKETSDDGIRVLRERAQLNLNGIALMDSLSSMELASVSSLGEGVNSNFQDLAPKVIDENTMLMGSMVNDSVINYDYEISESNDYYAELFIARKSGDSWTKERLDDGINEMGAHVGNGIVSEDGQTLFYTRCTEVNGVSAMQCRLYKANKVGNDWGSAEEIVELNGDDFTTTQPSLGYDSEQNEVLYFVSNREGGQGGLDVWYTSMQEDGTYASPTNLKEVNTKFDEFSPYYDNQNQRLYFSSMGYPGMGGFDVFYVDGNLENWTSEVTNAGAPINSPTDDIYFALDDKGRKGYMVSNRVGTTSLRGETCCDDVFEVEMNSGLFISGYFASRTDASQSPIDGVTANTYMDINGSMEMIGDDVTEGGNSLVYEVGASNIKVVGDAEGYYQSVTEIDASAFDQVEDTLFMVYLMDPIIRERITVKPVYFAFDQSDISELYQVELDSLYSVLVRHPDWILQIAGHTDNRGTDAYNDALGKRRANSAKDYLMALGAADSVDLEDRIMAISKGESDPIADNESATGEDNPQGRAKNRRVTFRLLNDVNAEEDGIEIKYEDADPQGTF